MAWARVQSQADWQDGRLAVIPAQWRQRVEREHARRVAEFEQIPATRRRVGAVNTGNAWLRDTAAAVVELLDCVRVPVDVSDAELCDVAESCARAAFDLALGPVQRDAQALRARLGAYVAGWGIEPPACEDDGPAVARMTDPGWWRRALRRAQGRALEGAAVALGFVHRRDQIYASDATVTRRTQQRRRNTAALEGTEAVNLDTGEVYNLGELAARSVANPVIRRGELMVRIRGFEEVAESLGHVAEFVTLTCPSRFHRMTQAQNGRVIDNPKHDGATPREAQQHLVKTWANARAKLHRKGVRCYGFRIAEPHHDGCPHWHLLLFVAAEHADVLRAVLTEHALKVDGDEPGAKRNRILFKRMDPGQGGAAGYVAKYVSKNIDGGGYVVQGDLEGDDAYVPTSRVEAWASTWGIRQFQQIGGPPVGVWRELRRTEAQELDGASETVKAAHAAADDADWFTFCGVIGGPTCERKNLRIRTAYTAHGERYATEGGFYPATLTRYGETARPVAYGVRDAVKDRVHPSRRYRWEVKHGKICKGIDGADTGKEGALVAVAWAAGQQPATSEGVAGVVPGVGVDVVGAPRTRVNNCPGGVPGEGREHEIGNDQAARGGAAGRAECLGEGASARQGDGGGLRRAAAACARRAGRRGGGTAL